MVLIHYKESDVNASIGGTLQVTSCGYLIGGVRRKPREWTTDKSRVTCSLCRLAWGVKARRDAEAVVAALAGPHTCEKSWCTKERPCDACVLSSQAESELVPLPDLDWWENGVPELKESRGPAGALVQARRGNPAHARNTAPVKRSRT
jgi:hypothetical protein